MKTPNGFVSQISECMDDHMGDPNPTGPLIPGEFAVLLHRSEDATAILERVLLLHGPVEYECEQFDDPTSGNGGGARGYILRLMEPRLTRDLVEECVQATIGEGAQ